MTNVLVTGATGFIGRFLISYLVEQGVSVRALVRKRSSDIFPETVEQYVGDLTDPTTLTGVAEGRDVVFHLGGYAHAWRENAASEKQHEQVNLKGTENILNESIRSHVGKFVFFSTIKAVGETSCLIDETWEAQPISAYGRSKRMAEELVLSAGNKNHLAVCILRLSIVYGPGLKGNLLKMLQAIEKGYFLPVPPVKNYLSLISVYDVCYAAKRVAEEKLTNGRIYFLSEENYYSTYELYALMRAALGLHRCRWHVPLIFFKILAWVGDQCERCVKRRLPFNSQAYQKLFASSRCSASRLQKELGFSPHYSLAQLMPEIVRVYREEKSCSKS